MSENLYEEAGLYHESGLYHVIEWYELEYDKNEICPLCGKSGCTTEWGTKFEVYWGERTFLSAICRTVCVHCEAEWVDEE